MECQYCRTANADEDHRCRRCARRLEPEPAHSGRQSRPYQQWATAPKLEFEEVEAPLAEAAELSEPKIKAAPGGLQYQRSLFSSRELPRVVPFETIAPHSPKRQVQAAGEPRAPRVRHKKPIPGQGALDFQEPIRPGNTTAVDALIDCDAPIAVPTLRVVAVAFDLSLVAIGFAAFVSIFHFAGGQIELTKQSGILFGAVAGLLFLFYKLLWCLLETDSAGMRWAHLKLVNFYGQEPAREQRLFRFAASCLSVFAAGLGSIWALVDEEALTWHDHISKTFPTTTAEWTARN